jgi:phospholipid/cholesterol/gamma-HCH transport system substrate-binding protein
MSADQRPGAGVLRRALALVLLAALCATVTACWPLHGEDTISVTTSFSDVGDLADGAPVLLAAVPVGHVTHIELDRSGAHAVVTMALDRSAEVPVDVTAEVRRKTPLGERVISLAVPPGTTPASRPALLRDGATITHSKVVPELQDLVQNGTVAFTSVSAQQVGNLLDESAAALAGKGPLLHQVLSQLGDIASVYAGHTSEVTQVVDSLSQLASSLAPSAGATGQLLDNLSAITGTLAQQADRFYDLVGSLDSAAGQATSLLQTHFTHLTEQISGFRKLLDTVAGQQQALDRALTYLPRQNQLITEVSINGYAHLLASAVICGFPGSPPLPGGGEVRGDPLNGCFVQPAFTGPQP